MIRFSALRGRSRRIAGVATAAVVGLAVVFAAIGAGDLSRALGWSAGVAFINTLFLLAVVACSASLAYVAHAEGRDNRMNLLTTWVSVVVVGVLSALHEIVGPQGWRLAPASVSAFVIWASVPLAACWLWYRAMTEGVLADLVGDTAAESVTAEGEIAQECVQPETAQVMPLSTPAVSVAASSSPVAMTTVAVDDQGTDMVALTETVRAVQVPVMEPMQVVRVTRPASRVRRRPRLEVAREVVDRMGDEATGPLMCDAFAAAGYPRPSVRTAQRWLAKARVARTSPA
ncbi:hypothetical protein SAMN05421595_2617 [Austwickia chelonae]|uniref:DUF2637 domain-containing protein n=1 Tax=Austwickia chelonae NBRC 105200 TaxID=1184607 RepID=K6WBU9_9MICO|nr:hypothetical protein [Austwickia chelonae]GAB79307.1 hypothetical protein AUCHE_22_00770 [Austwickia chelonae NBRC 105200]SEW38147.1 hypothetical protein SAMN05421595_2617 [Austwickia chelonae]